MGSGGGKSSTPKMLDDNLRSKQYYKVLDLISEGPIYGPVDQNYLSSFMLNDTPVTSSTGTTNINGISVGWRPGSETQSPMSGFNAIEATTIVNTDVEFDTPLVRTITDPDVSRVRVTLGVTSLVEQDNKGNQKNTSVTMVIETRTGTGSFIIQETVTITGKISGDYLEAHVIAAPDTTPFDVRVRRITPDSDSDLLSNGTIWNSYTEITDDSLSYPFAAIVGTVIDHDQYQDTPRRTYHARGLIVNIPDNYDPVARTYSGLWTGGFKQAWTNNPAWIFRELVVNARFGLARTAGSIDVDDGALYNLSQFCDQLVNDGYGGKEPRVTLNAYITEQISARELLDKIAGAFRGMALWDGMRMSVLIDAPADPVMPITNANVVDGKFSYSSPKSSEIFNAVVVSWTDPDNGWKQSKEYVSDDTLISRSGYNETTIEAFGCTSRGQAYRAGRFMLETAKRESKRVKFQMARDAIAFMPGDIVEVMDNNYAASRLGGRIVSHDGNQITVDADVSTLAGSGDSMSIMGSNGKLVKYEISTVSGPLITLESAPAYVRDGTVFVISTANLSTRLFRIMSVAESENNSIYDIVATLHDPNKQAVVDDGAVFDTPNDTLNGYRVPNVERLTILNIASETVQSTATWETATTTRKLTFEIRVYTEDGSALVAQYETDQYRYDFYGLNAGSYILGVRGRNDNGMKGAETQVSLVIGAPVAPASVVWTAGIFSADLVPVMPVTSTSDTTFEYWYSGTVQITDVSTIEDTAQFLGRSSQWTLHGLKADTTYYVYVRTRNAFGVSPFVEASGQASADIPGMIDYIDEAIRDSGAFGNLQQGVDTNLEGILQNALANNATVNRQYAQYGEVRAEVMTVTTTVANLQGAFSDLSTYVQAEIGPDGSLMAAVNQKLTAQVTDDGTASSFYTLNLGIQRDGQLYNAGMAMGIEPDGGGGYTSTAIFAADQFGIYSGSDPGNYEAAFLVNNGQVFINSAFMDYASITLAKVGSWYSANYVAGQTGTVMNSDGSFELNGYTAGQGRSLINNGGQKVYDANGILRVVVGQY
ncbi:host specificity protein J [Kosakonia sacchari]|uniref:host specificity protein J n=1 Tax=Kosakonia sacchari TaxID=1158459 RepID=UPI001585AA63|nr:phage tail protein [Kosakonia sacchari]NUL36648.1 host specificity protein J [Kosakonia sacchari]